MKKIFISGKTEYTQECVDKFTNYGKRLGFGSFSMRTASLFIENGVIGFTHTFIINRFLLQHEIKDHSLKNDIRIILECDEIRFFPDWNEDENACFEHELAVKLKIKIVYI